MGKGRMGTTLEIRQRFVRLTPADRDKIISKKALREQMEDGELTTLAGTCVVETWEEATELRQLASLPGVSSTVNVVAPNYKDGTRSENITQRKRKLLVFNTGATQMTIVPLAADFGPLELVETTAITSK